MNDLPEKVTDRFTRNFIYLHNFLLLEMKVAQQLLSISFFVLLIGIKKQTLRQLSIKVSYVNTLIGNLFLERIFTGTGQIYVTFLSVRRWSYRASFMLIPTNEGLTFYYFFSKRQRFDCRTFNSAALIKTGYFHRSKVSLNVSRL